jgi:hypothetical protein
LLNLARDDYKKRVDSGGVVMRRSLTEKDPELIAAVNKISQAVKVNKFTDLHVIKTELPLDYLEENLMGQLPFDGRILVEEYYKALYLNDENPETYNINYWSEYFKVTTMTLRNIFNYVFFPIPDEKNPSDVGKILYFKDAELSNRRKLISQMTGEEYKDYLGNTDKRPELEELKRLDYIKFQVTSDQPRMSERTVPYTLEELDDELEGYLKKSSIMKEVDANISNYVKATIEGSGLELDKDVRKALEQIKKDRLEGVEKKLIEEKMKQVEDKKKEIDIESENTNEKEK